MASSIMGVWLDGKLKYRAAKSWTVGSISMIVVSMPWAMRAEGVVPMPRPLI